MDKHSSKPPANVLVKLAANLKALALERAQDPDPELRKRPVTHVLGSTTNQAHGARLALYLTRNSNHADVWRLRIARPGVFPSEVEMDTFRRDFGVGFPCMQENVTYTRKQDDGSETVFYGYVLQWSLKSDTAPVPEKEMIKS